MTRWITDYLATAAWDEVEAVPNSVCLDVRDLVDKAGNTPDAMLEKIDPALAALAGGRKVLVCCDYGISRSNVIAACVLARHEQIGFVDALERVVQATGQSEMDLDVVSLADRALAGQPDPPGSAPVGSGGKTVLVTGVGGPLIPLVSFALEPEHATFDLSGGSVDLQAGPVPLFLWARNKPIDTVVHLAWAYGPGTNEAMGKALVALKNVADVCRRKGLRLILISSAGVFSGYREEPILAAETLPRNPRGTLTQGNCLAEYLVETVARQYGLDFCIVRSSLLYGQPLRTPKFLLTFVRRALAGKEIVTHEYQNGLPRVDLLHWRDFCSGLKCVMDRPEIKTLHLGSGEGISTRELAESIVRLSGLDTDVTARAIEDCVAEVVLDTATARQELGWKPKVTLQAGLEELVNACAQESKETI